MITPGIVSSLIFLISLYLIFSEKLNRTITSMLGAVLMVGAGLYWGFYNQEEALAAIDFNTLGLLFGMMMLVALLEPTGFFQYLAVLAGRFSNGSPVRLLILLGIVTTVLSMFLDNVTTVVLIAPITILISEVLGVSAIPLLMAEALLSNTGGVATLVGDPPNVLIASAAGFSFNDFLTHSLPIVIVVWFVALGLIRYLFRKELDQVPTNKEAIFDLDPQETLQDVPAVRKVLIVLGVAITLFFFEEWMHLSTSFIALAAAAIALVWVRPKIETSLERLEWSVLLFFAALFVMVGGLEASGVLHQLATVALQAPDIHPAAYGVLLIWVVAILSAVVDNIPITIALIPIIQELGASGMEVNPLWWALAFGAGFGGNGTLIGSTANIVVVTLSERTHFPITSHLWNRRGLPVMIATCATASILYLVAYPWLRQ
jgi:Na+/H+ antiporter NhaD/arsenite permease-like protein